MCAAITKYRQAQKKIINVDATKICSAELKYSVLLMSVKMIKIIE